MEFTLKTLPFTDAKLKYDEAEEMYIIKDDYINNRLNIVLSEELGSDNEVNAFLYEISDKLYEYIFRSANKQNKSNNLKIKQYKLDRDHDLRKYLAKALLAHVRASIRTDIDRMSDEGKFDFETNMRRDIKANDHIPTSVKDILEQSGIMYRGVYKYETE